VSCTPEQAVAIHANAVAGPVRVARENPLDGVIERPAIRFRDVAFRGFHSGEILVSRDDVPERGVDGVELRLVASVGEAVREHAFGDGIGPLEQNPARVVEAAAGETEPAHGDERVPTPVGEPGVARHDRHPGPAPHQIGVRGAVQGRREGLPPQALRRPQLSHLGGQRHARARAGTRIELSLEIPQRFAGRQVPGEAAGRHQVFDEVQPPVALFGIQESAVP